MSVTNISSVEDSIYLPLSVREEFCPASIAYQRGRMRWFGVIALARSLDSIFTTTFGGTVSVLLIKWLRFLIFPPGIK